MAFAPIAGTYIDVATHPLGYALVYVPVSNPNQIVAIVVNSAGVRTEVWRQTHTGPLLYVRCAVDNMGNIGVVAAVGSNTGPDVPIFLRQSGITALGGAVVGRQPVMVEYSSGWVVYLCRSQTHYVAWPIAGAEPAAIRNPFPGGTTLGIIDVIGGVITWGQELGSTADYKKVVIKGVTFVSPQTRGGVTVGQSVGAPVAAEAILAGQPNTFVSTVIPLQAFEPHIARTASGGWVIVARTLLSGGNAAAIMTGPPWPTFEGDGLAASQQSEALRRELYVPSTQSVFDPTQMVDPRTGKFSQPWLKFFGAIQRALLRQLDLTSATGVLSPPQGGTGGTTGLDVLNASNLLNGTVPQPRKWSQTTITTTGTEDDYDFNDADLLKAENATLLTLTGLLAGVGGQRLAILAAGAANVVLNDEDNASALPNQIITGTGGNLALTPGEFALLSYDSDSSRWRVMETGSGGSTSPGGSDTEVQFNDGGSFGGDPGLTWDKTKGSLAIQNLVTARAALIARRNSGVVAVNPSSATYADLLLQAFTDDSDNYIPVGTDWSYFWKGNDQFTGVEMPYGETPNVISTFARAVGFLIGGPASVAAPSLFDVYQYGGLGTGAQPGLGVRIGRNDSGSGAAGGLGLIDRSGTAVFFWWHDGALRQGSARPTESDSVPHAGAFLPPPFQLLTADPSSPANDSWWVVRTGTSPTMTLAVKCRVGGVTYTIASITA